MIKVKVDKVKSNPKNPRLIKDEKFKKLVKSIKDFPEMETVRPIVVNKDMVILGGNMRYKAMIECGYKEVNVEVVEWSEQKQNEFIIKDNVGFGEWEWEMVANEWDEIELKDWGMDLPVFDNGDYSEKNKELDINDIEDLMVINLKYTEDEYHIVKDALLKIASTPEQAIWKLIGNE
jgi:hypothetical protein